MCSSTSLKPFSIQHSWFKIQLICSQAVCDKDSGTALFYNGWRNGEKSNFKEHSFPHQILCGNFWSSIVGREIMFCLGNTYTGIIFQSHCKPLTAHCNSSMYVAHKTITYNLYSDSIGLLSNYEGTLTLTKYCVLHCLRSVLHTSTEQTISSWQSTTVKNCIHRLFVSPTYKRFSLHGCKPIQ